MRPEPSEQLQLFHVVSPVPADSADAAERRRIWREVMAVLGAPIEIPFDARLLWEEKLLGVDEPRSEMATRYGQVVERIDVARDTWLIRLRAASREAEAE